MDVRVQLSCSAEGWMVSLVVLFYLEKIEGGERGGMGGRQGISTFSFSLNCFSRL